MSTTSDTTLETFRTLLSTCREQSIPLVQIRYRPITEDIAYDGNDHDFLLCRQDKEKFLALVHTSFSGACIPLFIDQQKRDKTVLCVRDTELQRDIIFEIWYSLEVSDPGHNGINYIWWPDISGYILETADGYTLEPTVEALYYLSRLHTKRKQLESREVQKHISHYQHTVNDSDVVATLFQELIAQGDIKHIAGIANQQLIRMGILRSRKQLPSFTQSLFETLRNRRYKTRIRRLARGNIIAFVGPDGVGRATIISEYKQHLAGRVKYYRFKKLFRNALLNKLLLPVLRLAAAWHHKTALEKNQIDKHFGGTLFLISRLRFFKISVRRLWRTTLLADRNFHDFLSHGLRFSHLTPQTRRGAKLLLPLLPPPRCLIQLDATY